MNRDEIAAKIQQARQERAQKEYAETYQEVKSSYDSNREMREQAARDGDRASWDYWDSQLEQDERDLQAFYPVQEPQMDQRAAAWVQINKSFVDRYGQRAKYALDLCDGYVCRPKVRGETDLKRTGMGIEKNSPAYFRAIESLLQTHGPLLAGVEYNPNDKALTPDAAAKISGLSPRHYNHSVQTLQAQGRIGRDD